MFKIEKKFLEWIEKHLTITVSIAVLLVSLEIRWSLRDFVSVDSAVYLLPWYDEIKSNGGIHGLSQQVGDYNMLYQFLIAIMTYIPISSLHAYKMLSILFDYGLAFTVGTIVKQITGNKQTGIFAFLLVTVSPLVFLNSSAWGQCDAIYTCFIMLTILAVLNENYKSAFLLLGLAFSFKLQAVFILPFILLIYFVKKKFSVLYFLIIPAMMILTSMPCLVMGRAIGDIFAVYFAQTGTYEKIAVNYPSFWVLLDDTFVTGSYKTMKIAAIAVTVLVLGAWMLAWILKKVVFSSRNMIYMAFVLCYTCVLFLPAMHDRYGFCYEIFAVIIAFLNIKTVLPAVMISSISLVTYGNFLFGRSMNLTVLTIANLVTYIIYMIMLQKELIKNSQENKGEN